MAEQFWLLQKGDVIRGVKHGSPYRLILRVSKNDKGKTTFVEMEKLKRSWTNGNTTLYCSSEAGQFLPVKVKDERIYDMTYESVMRTRRRKYRLHYRRLADQAKGKWTRYRLSAIAARV